MFRKRKLDIPSPPLPLSPNEELVKAMPKIFKEFPIYSNTHRKCQVMRGAKLQQRTTIDRSWPFCGPKCRRKTMVYQWALAQCSLWFVCFFTPLDSLESNWSLMITIKGWWLSRKSFLRWNTEWWTLEIKVRYSSSAFHLSVVFVYYSKRDSARAVKWFTFRLKFFQWSNCYQISQTYLGSFWITVRVIHVTFVSRSCYELKTSSTT